MMAGVLEWARARTLTEAVVSSLIANVAIFGATLAIGHCGVRLFRRRPVSEPPDCLDRDEIALAAACVVLNSLVMFGGWLLLRAGWLHVAGVVGPGRALGDALVLLLVMDFAMYATHRLAHQPVIFRYVHGVHHRYERVRPLTLFVLHPLEVLGFGGLWIALLLAGHFSLAGMVLYLLLNTLYGVTGHLGVEPLPERWRRRPLARVVGTSTFHAGHHRDPRANFGFYTTIWDRMFRTLGRT